jgi:hypothetical protein
VDPATLDFKLHASSVSLHVLHRCLDQHPSELFALSFPESKLRFVKNNGFLLLADITAKLEVSQVKEFTRSIVVRETRVQAEVSFGRSWLVSIEVVGTTEIDLHPESVQILSHAMRGLVQDLDALRQGIPLTTTTSLQTACSCARVCFFNQTGYSLWFKQHGAQGPSMCVVNGANLAFSWACCTCGLPTTVPRAVCFSLEDDDDEWSAPIDVEQVGTQSVEVKWGGQACFIFVEVHLGGIQTLVSVYASNCVVNDCETDLEVAASGGSEVPFLVPARSTRHFMTHTTKTNGGWVFRGRGATSWSRPFTSTTARALVEVPASVRDVFVWVTPSNPQGWDVLRCEASFVVENCTEFELVVRARPEHRWESYVVVFVFFHF